MKCKNCGRSSGHCPECNSCYPKDGQHAGWCSKEPGQVAHRKRQKR